MGDDKDFLGPEVREFLNLYFDSVGTLEIVLFCHKRPESEWTIAQLATELRNNTSAIASRVAQLLQKEILKQGSSNASFKYGPTSALIAELIEKLSLLYPRYQARIIDQIYRPKNKAANEFANAFKLTKEGGDG